MDLTANVLLAGSAKPAMVSSADECEAFARGAAEAVLINMGTLTSDAVAAMRLTMLAARESSAGGVRHVPVVLDPVACGATPYRTAACVEALKLRPLVVRGNAGEVLALAQASGCYKDEAAAAEGGGDASPLVRGVDSMISGGDPRVERAAEAMADAYGCVVAVSGEVDFVVSPVLPPGTGSWPADQGRRPTIRVRNGVEDLTRVTAAGCAMTALVAAYVAVHHTWDNNGPNERHMCVREVAPAVAAAMCIFGVAAEIALERARRKGPGSLRVGLVDELALMTREELKARVRVEDPVAHAGSAVAGTRHTVID